MGFRSFHAFNLAMLAKHTWNFISNPNTLASRLIKAKYFLNGNFLAAQLGSNVSFTWKSIWMSQFILKQGCRWRIEDGSSKYLIFPNNYGHPVIICDMYNHLFEYLHFSYFTYNNLYTYLCL